MELKLDTVYRTKEGKELTEEKEKFNNVKLVSWTEMFVIMKSEVDGEEQPTRREAFERVYEQKPIEALKPEEKISHIFKKVTYALTALQQLSQTNQQLVGNPNMTIINNSLHEITLLTSPVPTSLTAQFEETLREETTPPGIDFLQIEEQAPAA